MGHSNLGDRIGKFFLHLVLYVQSALDYSECA